MISRAGGDCFGVNLSSVLFLVVIALTPARVRAQGTSTHAEHLGTVDFPVSCSSEAQREFNRGVALLHHMTYPRAKESFQQVALLDPQCAMAHWGIAMTLFQPLWPTRPGPAALRNGWAEIERARSLNPPTERERSFLEAGAAFFQAPDSADYGIRIRRWNDAMRTVYATFPQDPEAAAFYALSLLALPASNADSGRAHSDLAATLLLSVYQRNPDHPGAMHYLVHANDIAGREHDSLDIIGKYESMAPANPHALHMPTHIYTRLGDWDASIRGNLLAADAALRQPAGDNGEFVWDEFPHAIEYLVYAYLQKGDDDSAAAQSHRLQTTARLEPTFKTAFHLASTRARFALERHAWSEAMALVPRDPPTLDWNRFRWPEAVTWFARGLGAVHEHKLDVARTAVDRLDSLEVAERGGGEEVFARNIRVLKLEISAWLAQSMKDTVTSIALMREAAALESATPKPAVTPAPSIPAYELLGDLLMEQEHPSDALVAYERSLGLYPRRFNSLLGAARAARASGSDSGASAFYQQLLDVAAGSRRTHELGEARAFLNK
ncbi:MAG: hypothetical protein ABI679_08710 [Gemmatimonadota bacterium]